MILTLCVSCDRETGRNTVNMVNMICKVISFNFWGDIAYEAKWRIQTELSLRPGLRGHISYKATYSLLQLPTSSHKSGIYYEVHISLREVVWNSRQEASIHATSFNKFALLCTITHPCTTCPPCPAALLPAGACTWAGTGTCWGRGCTACSCPSGGTGCRGGRTRWSWPLREKREKIRKGHFER